MVKNNSNSSRILFFLLSFLILHLSAVGGFFTANATVRYVSHSGSNTPPYLTWETAADSIMFAINISVFGDTIYVANGIYEEQVTMISGLTLIGAGMDSCLIDTRKLVLPNDFFAVVIKDGCTLKNFRIITSNDNLGTGCLADSGHIIIKLNRIEKSNTGIRVLNSDTQIEKNIITAVNRGIRLLQLASINYLPFIFDNLLSVNERGIQVSFGTNPTIISNLIYLQEDFARGYSGSLSDSVKIFNNLIIAERKQLHTWGFGNSGVPTFEFNNVVIGNIESGFRAWDENVIKNNIIMNAMQGINKLGTNVEIKFNDAWNNVINYKNFTPDSTNLSIDPMIVNEDSLDFHLEMFSPLIDAGDPDILDLDGTRSDIGFYGGPFGERYKYLDLAPKPPRNLSATIDSNFITLIWNPNTEADFNSYNLFRDTTANFTADSTTFVIGLTDTFYQHIIPPETDAFYYKLTATDNQGNESQPSEELAVIITSVNDYPSTVSNYQLYQNYPNPFNPSTTIGYKLKERGYVKLMVYDIKGELVDVLVNQVQEAGYYEVEFGRGLIHQAQSTAEQLASGIYIYQIMIKSENSIPVFTDMKKMLMIK